MLDYFGKKKFKVFKMSYMLGHLHNGWQVDQAILSEEDRVVVSISLEISRKLLQM